MGLSGRVLALCCLFAVARALEQSARLQDVAAGKDTPDDLAGPIVRATIDRARDSIIRQANLSREEKKKTIAQIIDEALEQEFPEEKVEAVGKNYNETAKQEDVCANTGRLTKCR